MFFELNQSFEALCTHHMV